MVRKASLSPGQPSKKDIAEYWKVGFLILRGQLSLDVISGLNNECRKIWSEIDITSSNKRIQYRPDSEGLGVADRIDPVMDLSPVLQTFSNNPDLLNIAHDIIGSDAELFKMKLISKWPGISGYAMHQDYTYWKFVGDVDVNDFVNIVVPLDIADAESGAIEVFPGLHHCKLDPPENNPNDVDESKMDTSKGVILELSPGDIALFHSMTPHRSGTNNSIHNRETLILTYIRIGYGGLYSAYYKNRPDDWLD